MIFYIWGDDGPSAQGQRGTISELLAHNSIPYTIEQQLAAVEEIGGLDEIGGPKTDPIYHSGWAWAGATPYKGTMSIPGYLGAMRNPMGVRWPARIKPDATPRAQFHHCNDIVPTIYEILGITPPREVNGVPQDPIDGVSLAYTFDDPAAEGRLQTQYFDTLGSRGIYHKGWFAGTMGPRAPWVTGLPPGIFEWTPDKDTWELYNLDEDWTQANDLAAEMPEKLAQLQELWLVEATRNNALPIGAGFWVLLFHPEYVPAPPYTEWTFFGDSVRIPEFTAPKLGTRPNVVTIDAVIPSRRQRCAVQAGRVRGRSHLLRRKRDPLLRVQPLRDPAHEDPRPGGPPAGEAKIEIETNLVDPKQPPRGPLNVTMKVNGDVVAEGTVPVSCPIAFSATECLDIGISLGSAVSPDYYDKKPFKFNGTIERVDVRYVSPDVGACGGAVGSRTGSAPTRASTYAVSVSLVR